MVRKFKDRVYSLVSEKDYYRIINKDKIEIVKNIIKGKDIVL